MRRPLRGRGLPRYPEERLQEVIQVADQKYATFKSLHRLYMKATAMEKLL